MSLDVYLKRSKWVSYDEGKTHTKELEDVYHINTTHNLGRIAKEAGIYKVIWRPEEIGKEKAQDVIQLLEVGLAALKARPEYFSRFDNSNGWGHYENFVPFVENYLNACKEYPLSSIKVSR